MLRRSATVPDWRGGSIKKTSSSAVAMFLWPSGYRRVPTGIAPERMSREKGYWMFNPGNDSSCGATGSASASELEGATAAGWPPAASCVGAYDQMHQGLL